MDCRGVDTPKVAWYAACGALVALLPAVLMWGFTVDDALISIRYAHHLVTGGGYAFNAHGPSTDGVTPLPWPFLLAPLAHTSDLVAILVRAKVLGIIAWTLAGAALGARVRSIPPLLLMGLAFPIGAWAASGMETGLALALTTFAAVSFDRPNRAGVLAGLAAALRPELLPWSLVIAFGATIAKDRQRLPVLYAFAPSALCMILRNEIFGHPVPLAIMAKPSDASNGIVYAVAAVVVGLLPIVVCAPFALRTASVRAKTIVLATIVHFLVMIAVGGDWMPYARLIVPVLPALTLVAAEVSTNRIATGIRYAVAGALGIYTAAGAAPAGRHVHSDRKSLIERARPVLASAKVVAALDIGWVGAATDASIVDLAGLTDPSIAALSGGHTSKHVDVVMLLDRNVDTVVVFEPSRVVEQRLLRTPLFEERFARTTTLPLGASTYIVFTRK